MPEETLQQEPQAEVKPVEQAPIEQKAEVKEPPKEDLITRVAKFKPEVKQTEPNPFNLTKEDYEKVQSDPILSKFYKSMQSDYVKKTQNLSQKEKELEKIKIESANWTPERIQQLLNDPNFVQSAQKVAEMSNPPNSGLTNEEFSALTDKEKAQLQQANQRITNLEMQNWQLQQRQQDEQLRTKYPNYAPDIVDTTIKQLVKGEVRADRETVWKALDYDSAIQRAYELGKQDRAMDNTVKTQSMSIEGYNATPNNSVPQQDKGESNNAYFKRLATRRLSELKGLSR